MTYEAVFQPMGRRVDVAPDSTLLEAAQKAGIGLIAICGGQGVCGRCMIRVMSGPVSSVTETEEDELVPEEIAAGFRLACQARIKGAVLVNVPPESLDAVQRTQVEGQFAQVSPLPAVDAVEVTVPPATLDDLRSDVTRLHAALPIGLASMSVDIEALRTLPDDLRAWDWQTTAFIRGGEVIAVRPPGAALLGLAVDLGTTKLAGYLMNLVSGETLAAAGAMNPQIAYGEDVMARISHALSKPEGGEDLRRVIVDGLNNLAQTLCSQSGENTADIAEAVIVGNTAMHHLFLGLPVGQLGRAPYVPAVSEGVSVRARDAGLVLASGAYVNLLPNIAGFVGADHVAMLLASGLVEADKIVLGMDIGTNTEVSLKAGNRVLSCSTASGPAFEGAHITQGMRAAPGAIEHVALDGGKLHIKTVGDERPVGFCGSGLLDVVAMLRQMGALNARGGMLDHESVRRGEHGPEFVLLPAGENDGQEIFITRNDVSELQLAKGAMRAGVRVLVERAGIAESDIDQVIVAGAFGTYLDVQSGVAIGMFPRLPRHRFRQVGNAAGAGARMALLSLAERARAEAIAARVEYVELTTAPEFERYFAQSLMLE
jgi:uncharacterized 2Fe-2S/4Fe-4S cluster protein (DUF4445 family)